MFCAISPTTLCKPPIFYPPFPFPLYLCLFGKCHLAGSSTRLVKLYLIKMLCSLPNSYFHMWFSLRVFCGWALTSTLLNQCFLKQGWGCSRVEARGSVGDHLGHILTCCLVWQGWGETRWECVLNAGPCRNPDCLFVIPMCTFCFTHMPSCTTYKTPTQTHFCEHTRTQIHVTHRHTHRRENVKRMVLWNSNKAKTPAYSKRGFYLWGLLTNI